MEQPSIIFFGTPNFSVTIVHKLANNFSVKGIVTAPDAVVGRADDKIPTPVKQWAVKNNVASFSPDRLKDNQDLIGKLRDLDADLFVVASYGKIIPQTLLDIPKLGAINWHPSLLPKYRGPSPVPFQIMDGALDTGVTLIQMNAAMDAGPILAQQTVPLSTDATSDQLLNALADLGSAMLVDLLPKMVDGSVTASPQDDNRATYTKLLSKQDGFIALDKLAGFDKIKLDRMIRAYCPWPTVWTVWDGKTIKLLPQGKVQLEGKTPVPVKQFLNGYPQAKPWLTPYLD